MSKQMTKFKRFLYLYNFSKFHIIFLFVKNSTNFKISSIITLRKFIHYIPT